MTAVRAYTIHPICSIPSYEFEFCDFKLLLNKIPKTRPKSAENCNTMHHRVSTDGCQVDVLYSPKHSLPVNPRAFHPKACRETSCHFASKAAVRFLDVTWQLLNGLLFHALFLLLGAGCVSWTYKFDLYWQHSMYHALMFVFNTHFQTLVPASKIASVMRKQQ